MNSWNELREDIVLRVQMDFSFRLKPAQKDGKTSDVEGNLYDVFDVIKHRAAPRIKGESPSAPSRRGSDSGSSSASSTAPIENLDEWKESEWTSKEINATLLEYCAHLLDSSYVNGPSPVGRIVCSHHNVHRFSATHWTLSKVPGIKPYKHENGKAKKVFLRLTSRWYAASEISSLASQVDDEIGNILSNPKIKDTDYTWANDEGWPGTHGYGGFPGMRLVVGLNTRTNINSNPPQPPAWTTAVNLLCTWHVFGDDIRQERKTLYPKGTQTHTDARTFFDALYACTSAEHLQNITEVQQQNDIVVHDEALNATAFMPHQATFNSDVAGSWLRTAFSLYGFATALDLNNVRFLDILPAGTTTASYNDFKDMVGFQF